ncbi:MAG TPA: arginine--tRNA ligase [bacterium]|nr:arginine--tRNA ligase [bacterium]
MKITLEGSIQKAVQEYIRRKGIELPGTIDLDLSLTRDTSHGDYATNVAFKIAKQVKEKPNLVADEIVLLLLNEMEKNQRDTPFERVVVAGGGFINFYLSKSSLACALAEAHEKDWHFGDSDFGHGRKVLLEFISANPTGPLTIAHGRQAAVGDAMARVLKKTGHEVTTEYYLNDAGRQMNLLGESLWARYAELSGEEALFPEEGYKGAYIGELAKKLAEMKGPVLLKETEEERKNVCRDFAKEEMMQWIRDDIKKLGVQIDHYFSESLLYDKKLVDGALNYLTDQGFLYEKDGALWFRSSTLGDDKDRVVKKSTGEYTYLAPDIAYHRDKFDRGFNWLVNLWGPDHHGYISRLKAACRALGHPADQIDIRIVQLTTLYRKGVPVRMSTRAGEFVTLKELMDEVGVDATRFFFIMRKIESPLDFDLDLAKEKSQENPVYYLQYAHARIASLLKYANQPVTAKSNLELLSSKEETDLIKIITEFSKVLVQTSEMLEPYRLADYLRDLATSFHKFYSLHRVVTEDQELTKARLLLVDATRITLRNGLQLLGISQPESM